MKRFFWPLLAGFNLAIAAPLAVEAQSYPAQPLRLIVPFPPGGLVDTLARLLSSELSNALEQRIIVDNRAGAGGSIGEGEAARSAPDGF